MTFAWPFLLWLIFLPAGWLAWEFAHGNRVGADAHPRILKAEAGSRSVEIRPRGSLRAGRGSRARAWLALGLALAIVALARPQWGRLDEPAFDQSREVILAMDLSRSMMTPDVKPSRLDRAKLLIQSLLDRLAGERVGLVVFSGTAFLQSPLSADYEILREFLPALGPDFLPEGGTNYSALIDTAAEAFSGGRSADRFLIILSDGGATDDDWRSHVKQLTDKGVRVLSLGIGTGTGALIPDGSGNYMKDDRGAVVISKLENDTLRELAGKTGGVYKDASEWVDLAALLKTTVETGKKGRFVEKSIVRYAERFQWALAPALLCFLISFWREFPARPKPRPIRLGPMAAVVLLFAVLFPAIGNAAADKSAAPSSGALLGRIVGRLSAQNSSSAHDWSELAQQTATWGEELRSSGQQVPAGPVRDGLAAVDDGSSLDPKATDWGKLRSRLEALLRKPEDKKQQEQKQQNQDQKKQDQKKQEQQKPDQQKQNQDGKGSQDQKQNDQQQSQPQTDQQNSRQSKPNPSNTSKSADSALGKMTPPAQQKEQGATQRVGGAQAPKQADPAQADPALAAPLQKLEDVRDQDSPAELFQMIENNEPHSAPKPGKNW